MLVRMVVYKRSLLTHSPPSGSSTPAVGDTEPHALARTYFFRSHLISVRCLIALMSIAHQYPPLAEVRTDRPLICCHIQK